MAMVMTPAKMTSLTKWRPNTTRMAPTEVPNTMPKMSPRATDASSQARDTKIPPTHCNFEARDGVRQIREAAMKVLLHADDGLLKKP